MPTDKTRRSRPARAVILARRDALVEQLVEMLPRVMRRSSAPLGGADLAVAGALYDGLFSAHGRRLAHWLALGEALAPPETLTPAATAGVSPSWRAHMAASPGRRLGAVGGAAQYAHVLQSWFLHTQDGGDVDYYTSFAPRRWRPRMTPACWRAVVLQLVYDPNHQRKEWKARGLLRVDVMRVPYWRALAAAVAAYLEGSLLGVGVVYGYAELSKHNEESAFPDAPEVPIPAGELGERWTRWLLDPLLAGLDDGVATLRALAATPPHQGDGIELCDIMRQGNDQLAPETVLLAREELSDHVRLASKYLAVELASLRKDLAEARDRALSPKWREEAAARVGRYDRNLRLLAPPHPVRPRTLAGQTALRAAQGLPPGPGGWLE